MGALCTRGAEVATCRKLHRVRVEGCGCQGVLSFASTVQGAKGLGLRLEGTRRSRARCRLQGSFGSCVLGSVEAACKANIKRLCKAPFPEEAVCPLCGKGSTTLQIATGLP